MGDTYFTIIHTDGGARPNPGQGAYAAILQYGNRTACVRGYAPYATNNQMELAAVIAGLHALKSTRIPVKLYVDSQYVHDGATRWLKNWRKNNWQTSSGEVLKNVELWQELDTIISRFVISWAKVESHAGNTLNNRADEMVWDIREAEGDPARYKITDIPTIESAWTYTSFENGRPTTGGPSALPAKATELKKRFEALLTCSPERGEGNK